MIALFKPVLMPWIGTTTHTPDVEALILYEERWRNEHE